MMVAGDPVRKCKQSLERAVEIDGTRIEDTFAEAFRMRFVRLLVTATDEHWLDAGLREFTGYSSSIISCDSETGVERLLAVDETPDGRPGAAVLVFGFSAETLAKVVPNRVGQCLMTCPTTAVFDGLTHGEKRIPLGKTIRYFGDGFQKSKLVAGRRYWRIPVMDGEFLIESMVHVDKGIGGGNLILQAETPAVALAAARQAVAAMERLPGVITPFPGGVARSGSKVGSRYKALKASTAEAYCPSLRGRPDVATKLAAGANAAYEIVIDGIDEPSIAAAMSAGMRAAAGPGVVVISAGNYGGKLGKFHFHLRQLIG
ncbi:MAG: formylmethanofuran--tetrahydromethanopterin N-formyltransferase [Pirellulales bacterium]